MDFSGEFLPLLGRSGAQQRGAVAAVLFRARGHQVHHADLVGVVVHAQAAELADGVMVRHLGSSVILLGDSMAFVVRRHDGKVGRDRLEGGGAELGFTADAGRIADDDLLLRGRAFVLGAIAVGDVRVAGVEAGKRFRSAGCGVQVGQVRGGQGNRQTLGSGTVHEQSPVGFGFT